MEDLFTLKHDKINNTARFSKLKFTDRVVIYNFLAEVIDTSEGYARYKEGYSDRVVAEKFNVKVTSIANLRAESFGKVRRVSNKTEKKLTLEARIQRLEEYIFGNK